MGFSLVNVNEYFISSPCKIEPAMSTGDERVKLEQAARLTRARIAAGFTSKAAAARALSMNYQTYVSYERGDVFVNSHAALFARKFHVEVRWLITGEGPMRPNGDHPVSVMFEELPPEWQDLIRSQLERLTGRRR